MRYRGNRGNKICPDEWTNKRTWWTNSSKHNAFAGTHKYLNLKTILFFCKNCSYTFISLCTTVVHNTAQNSLDSLCSDVAYNSKRRHGKITSNQNKLNHLL